MTVQSGDCTPYLERVLGEDLRAMQAYHVPPADGLIKLDAMENPYPWPEALKRKLLDRVQMLVLNRYPDSAARSLKQVLAAYLGVPAGAELLLGNGSDELIQLLAMAVRGNGRGVLAPEPSFSMYRIIARMMQVPYTGVALEPADFSLDAERMLTAVREVSPALVFLASPNNPTGNRFAPAVVESIIAAAPGLVVVDEAYAPFADDNMMSRVAACPNLLILRTLSKMGMAGIRLGVLVGPSRWIEELDKLRLPYNVNALTQAAAEVAMQQPDLFAEQLVSIREERDRLFQRLVQMPGVQVWPSEANFLLVRLAGRGAAAAEALRQRGVLVKNLHGTAPLLSDCLRITVGRPEENQALLQALADYLARA